MNIFKEINKLPHTDINEVSYGYKQHWADRAGNVNRKKIIEGKTYDEWAKHYGMSYSGICNRYRKNGSVHPNDYYRKDKIIEGKTIQQWAEHYGVSLDAIKYRLRKHGNPHPTNLGGRKAKIIEGKTIQQWAEHYGITKEAIRWRTQRHDHPHPTRQKKG